MFITFEGIDGSGKSTQLRLLAESLAATGQKVLLTREPGGTGLAEHLRHVLLETQTSAPAELLLFGAARAQHVAEVIRPALAEGVIVLCDRFIDSSVAYQGGGLGLSREFINAMNRFACADVYPSLTLLFDIAPLGGLQRQRMNQQKPDIIEARGLEFLEKVRQAYLQIADAEMQRVVVIDAAQALETVQSHVQTVLRGRGVHLT